MAITGKCLCGAVSYTIDAEPITARMCWCRDCQRIASGSATVNVVFPADAVDITGPVATYQRTADSGNVVERGFCSQCGSQLFSRTTEPKGAQIRMRAGTLDNPELKAPEAIIWTSSAPSWASLDPELPQFPAGPPAVK